jgi:hypothetical protein
MGRRILLIQGHPDAMRAHPCHARADAAVGALRARLAKLGRAGH